MSNILAVIPARGGSKGIKLKNLKKVGNISLVAHSIEFLKQFNNIKRIFVSTDHDMIIKESKKCGVEVPFKRPKNISGDYIGDAEVLLHALLECEKFFSESYDIVLMIQPTSPFRTKKSIDSILKKIKKNDFDAVWTVSKIDTKYHPKKILKLDEGKISYFDKCGEKINARQELTDLYHRNGFGYAIKANFLKRKKKIFSAKTGFIKTTGNFVNIDTEWDLEIANYLYKKSKM